MNTFTQQTVQTRIETLLPTHRALVVSVDSIQNTSVAALLHSAEASVVDAVVLHSGDMTVGATSAVLQRLQTHPLHSQWRICYVTVTAAGIAPAIQTQFLKIIEDGPSFVRFVFFVEQGAQLLSTIQSRSGYIYATSTEGAAHENSVWCDVLATKDAIERKKVLTPLMKKLSKREELQSFLLAGLACAAHHGEQNHKKGLETLLQYCHTNVQTSLIMDSILFL